TRATSTNGKCGRAPNCRRASRSFPACSHSTVLVEHPELVAERICRYAKVVGRENVIAGSDCGFATFAGSQEVHPSIVWAKFESLVEGAKIASQQLWGGR